MKPLPEQDRLDLTALKNTTTIREAAIEYARLGLAIFPINPETGTPHIKQQNRLATSDADQIEHWWKKWPDAWIGAACGNSEAPVQICAVDQDMHNGRAIGQMMWQAMQDCYGTAPNGGIHQTSPSGGKHLIYLNNPTLSLNHYIPKVDFQASAKSGIPGSHIVLWPSKGGKYQLGESDALIPLPDWMPTALEMFRTLTIQHGNRRIKLKTLFEEATDYGDKSGRNDWLYTAGISLAKSKLPLRLLSGTLGALNQMFKVPLGEGEDDGDADVEKVIEQVMSSDIVAEIAAGSAMNQVKIRSLEHLYYNLRDDKIYSTRKPMEDGHNLGAVIVLEKLKCKRAELKDALIDNDRYFENLVRYPGEKPMFIDTDTNSRCFNTFMFPAHQTAGGSIENFLFLAEDLYDDYAVNILDLLAAKIQNPSARVQIMPILVADYGIGKNLFASYYTKAIGRWNLTSSTFDNICGMGNSSWGDWSEGLFCLISEATMAGKKRYELASAAREKVTDDYLPINIKYGTSGTNRIFTMLWGFTNPDATLVIPPKDRRFLIHQSKGERKQKAWLDKAWAETKDPAVGAAVFNFLKNREITTDPYGHAPMTDFKKSLITTGHNEIEEAMLFVKSIWPSNCITNRQMRDAVDRYLENAVAENDPDYNFALQRHTVQLVTKTGRKMKLRWEGGTPCTIKAINNAPHMVNLGAGDIRKHLISGKEMQELLSKYSEDFKDALSIEPKHQWG